jgi:hypothetical protein
MAEALELRPNCFRAQELVRDRQYWTVLHADVAFQTLIGSEPWKILPGQHARYGLCVCLYV